jgi:O-antigen ligase
MVRRPSNRSYSKLTNLGGGIAAAGSALPRDPVRILFFALIVVSISRFAEHIRFLAAMRPALLLTMAALTAAVFARASFSPRNLQNTWPPKVMYALAFVACVSAAFGISLGSSAKFFLEVYVKVLVFALLVIAAIRYVRDLRLFVWAYVISVGILSYFSLFVFSLSRASGSYNLRLSGMYTYDSNDAGLVMVVGIPLTLLTLETSGKRGKLVSVLILLGMGASLARGGSRGAFLGLLVVGSLLLIAAKHVGLVKRLSILGALVVALLVAAPPGYWRQMQTIADLTEDYNWQVEAGRKAIWSRGLGYMMQRPIFGLGVGNFGRAEGTISEHARNAIAGEGVRWYAPHNSFIQAGAEMGVPGLALFATLVFGVIVAPIRARRRMGRDWLKQGVDRRFLYLACMYLPIAMAGFAVCGSLLSFAYMDPAYLLAAYAAGLQVCSMQLRQSTANPSTSRDSSRTTTLGPPATRALRSSPHPGHRAATNAIRHPSRGAT